MSSIFVVDFNQHRAIYNNREIVYPIDTTHPYHQYIHLKYSYCTNKVRQSNVHPFVSIVSKCDEMGHNFDTQLFPNTTKGCKKREMVTYLTMVIHWKTQSSVDF